MSYKDIKSFEQECRDKDAEIERLKALLTHAADALTYTRSCWGWLKETSSINELIAELRKAAE